MGNAHPSVYPYEPMPTADRDLIVAAPNDRLFRKLCDGAGHPRRARRPAVPAATPTAPPTGPSSGRSSSSGSRTRGAEEWFELLVDAGVPCGPINTIDGGFAMAEKFGLEPVVLAGEGERAMPMARNPITFSATPTAYPLPPPELDEHGSELRKWLES